jgi:hypothetical protein
MHRLQRSWDLPAAALAVAAGLLVAVFDVAAPFGDDTAKGTLFLWVVACGSLGLLLPRRPWRWALLVAPWLPVVHGLRHALGLTDSIHPNTYTTIAILVPISAAVCLLAAYGGALVRTAAGGGH